MKKSLKQSALLSITFVLPLLVSQVFISQVSAQTADILYFNGDILTMRGDQPTYVEQLAIKEGKILHAGTAAGAKVFQGPATITVDLAGKTLLPGFIDAHGHLVLASHTLLDADLVGVKNIAELLTRLKTHAETLNEGDRLVGMGYRAEQLAEKRHPTREELDSVSPSRSILISDGSGHHGVINSGLIDELKITAETPDPEGGVYFRKSGSRELDGHVAESALMGILATRSGLTPAQIRKGVAKAVDLWVENGQTTACEMGLGLSGDDIEIARTIIDEQLLPIDLVVFAKAAVSNAVIDAGYQVARKYATPESDDANRLLATRPDLQQRYLHRVRLGGIKFWLDGSIDTSFMSSPFTKNPPGVTTLDYRGMRVDPQKQLVDTVAKYWKSNRQIAGHAIGDEANEQLLIAIEDAVKKQGMTDHRPIFQHAQFLRPDQIQRIKAVGGIASFTAGGIYPMGDYIAELVGPERLPWVGPANSMVKHQVVWTIHHDMPAGVSPSLIYGMWNVVNRLTRSGIVLAPDERVTPYEALKSVTINAAYEFKEEHTKGTLEAGKLADLVILDKNPLKVPPTEINEIVVVETIKEGKSLYQLSVKPDSSAKPQP